MKVFLRIGISLLLILAATKALSAETVTSEERAPINSKNLRLQVGGSAFGTTQQAQGLGAYGWGLAAGVYYQFTYVPLAVGVEGLHALGDKIHIPFRLGDFKGMAGSIDVQLTKMTCLMPGILLKRSKPGFQPFVGVAMGACEIQVNAAGDIENRREVVMIAHLGGDFGMGENLALSLDMLRVGFLGEEIFLNPVAALTFMF